MTTDYFIDPVNGSSSAAATSFATRVNSPLSISGVIGPNPRFKYIKTPDPVSLGNATWTNNSATITLASAQTKTITTCESNWTGGTDVTCSLDSSVYKQGSNSINIDINLTGSGAKKAFFALGSAQNFSSYQKITFWIKINSVGSFPSATAFNITLCSDTSANTPVNTFNMSTDYVTGMGNKWVALEFDNGSALGASIQSIGFIYNTTSSSGTLNYNIDNFEACNNLSLQTLIGKNTGTETFYSIQSISGTTIILDRFPSSSNGAQVLTYPGSTATVTTYARSVIQPISPAQNSSAGLISGGWDSTNMSTQTGETWYDGSANSGSGFSASGCDIEKIGIVRCWSGNGLSGDITGPIASVEALSYNNNGINLTGTQSYLNNIGGCVSNITNGLVINALGSELGTMYNIDKNGSSGIQAQGEIVNIQSLQARGNLTYGMNFSGSGGTIGTASLSNNGNGLHLANTNKVRINSLTCQDNTSSSIQIAGTDFKIMNFSSSGSGSGVAINFNGTQPCNGVIYNADILEGTVYTNLQNYSDQILAFQNISSTLNNNITYVDGGTIVCDSGSPHTGGGVDYTITLSASSIRTFSYPIKMPLSLIAVESGSLVTFNAYCEVSNTSNVYAALVFYGGQVGVASDVVTPITGTSYSQYSLTFTPAENGVVEIFYIASVLNNTGGTARVSDLSYSQ